MTDWQDIRIGDLGEVVTGKTPPTSKSEYYGGTTQFLTPTDMDGRRIINQTIRYLSKEGENKVSSSLLPKGSVSVSCIGSDMGKTVLLGKKSVTNQQINSITVKDEFDNLFVYYNLSGRKSELQFLASGAAQPIMNKTDFSNLKIKVPPLTEQKAISSVLSALDNKIESNDRVNKTLEEMARTVYKSWFVDFDPVHAKATGNAPAHMDAKTANLFPISFGDDGLPSGWKKVYLKDLTNIVYGKNLPTKQLLKSGYPVFGGNGVIGFYSEYLYDEPQVLVACRGAASGKVIRSLPFSFVTNNSLVIEISSPHLNRFFLELYLKDLTLEGFTTGSAQPQMTIANMDAVKLLNPKKEILNCFQTVVEPFFDKVLANNEENKTLAELRDTLLPKLMSGKIRVKDAEREVEAAV